MSEAASRRRWWVYWIPVLAWMALIFVLSSQSGLRISEDAAVDRPFRITGHLLAFAGLAALLLFALCRGGRPCWHHVIIALGITVLYGASDELHQSFVPDRTGRVDDLVVDTIGAAVGLAVAWVVLTVRARSRDADGRGAAATDHPVGD